MERYVCINGTVVKVVHTVTTIYVHITKQRWSVNDYIWFTFGSRTRFLDFCVKKPYYKSVCDIYSDLLSLLNEGHTPIIISGHHALVSVCGAMITYHFPRTDVTLK